VTVDIKRIFIPYPLSFLSLCLSHIYLISPIFSYLFPTRFNVKQQGKLSAKTLFHRSASKCCLMKAAFLNCNILPSFLYRYCKIMMSSTSQNYVSFKISTSVVTRSSYFTAHVEVSLHESSALCSVFCV
jgi:hypothetical protein